MATSATSQEQTGSQFDRYVVLKFFFRTVEYEETRSVQSHDDIYCKRGWVGAGGVGWGG